MENKKTRIRDYLNLADATIYYEITGDGPALVFAHGLSGNHLSWWQQVPYFSDRYTCITFAHRGFPPSTEQAGSKRSAAFGDDLAALIDHLNLPQVYLVGQSMGGWTCVEYTFHHSEKVRGLILASTIGHLDDDNLTYPGIEKIPEWFEQAAQIKQTLKGHGIEAAAGARMAKEQPALHYLYREIDDFTTPEFKSKIGPGVANVPTRPLSWLARIGLPTLFIVGEEDVLFPAIIAEAAASVLPMAKVVSVPQAGHSVYFERAATFNTIVDEFLSSLSTK